jgi:IS30 family transposase
MRFSSSYKERAALERAFWERWKTGESLVEITKGIGMPYNVARNTAKARGGIAPSPRRRSRLALSLAEREEISRGLVANKSCRQIALEIGRSASTVSREVSRNLGLARYRAAEADEAAWHRSLRPKDCRLAVNGRLRRTVAQKLAKNWSPEQISGWLRQNFPDDKSMQISHETIYRTLFIQARGALKKELLKHLRARRAIRRAKMGTPRRKGQGQIPDMISIRDRPAEVEDRAIPGHWEGDLIAGTHNSWIATLVERQSRYTMLTKLNSKGSEEVTLALIKQVRRLPTHLRKSLTWDRGKEMTLHKDFSFATDVKVYFCDPHSPWQRGTNENTNGLLRQYFRKGTDISGFSQAELNKIAKELNQRPRKTLGFATPADTLRAIVR